MARVYKSEIKNAIEDEKTIIDCIKTKFGRDYFIKIIIKGNEQHVMKIMEKDSFKFFESIIFNSLLNLLKTEITVEDILYIVKLLKICLYIKTNNNKEEIILSDILFSRLENYQIFKETLFWKKWIEDDMTEIDIEIFKMIEKSKKENIYIDEENEDYKLYNEHSFEIIDKLTSIMLKMKLETSFIYSMITELSKEYIINDDKFSLLMKDLINELYYVKVILKGK